MKLSIALLAVPVSSLFTNSSTVNHTVSVLTVYRYINPTATIYRDVCRCIATALSNSDGTSESSSGAVQPASHPRVPGSGSEIAGQGGIASNDAASGDASPNGPVGPAAGEPVTPIATTYQSVVVQYDTSTKWEVYTTTLFSAPMQVITSVFTDTVTYVVPRTITSTVVEGAAASGSAAVKAGSITAIYPNTSTSAFGTRTNNNNIQISKTSTVVAIPASTLLNSITYATITASSALSSAGSALPHDASGNTASASIGASVKTSSTSNGVSTRVVFPSTRPFGGSDYRSASSARGRASASANLGAQQNNPSFTASAATLSRATAPVAPQPTQADDTASGTSVSAGSRPISSSLVSMSSAATLSRASSATAPVASQPTQADDTASGTSVSAGSRPIPSSLVSISRVSDTLPTTTAEATAPQSGPVTVNLYGHLIPGTNSSIWINKEREPSVFYNYVADPPDFKSAEFVFVMTTGAHAIVAYEGFSLGFNTSALDNGTPILSDQLYRDLETNGFIISDDPLRRVSVPGCLFFSDVTGALGVISATSPKVGNLAASYYKPFAYLSSKDVEGAVGAPQ